MSAEPGDECALCLMAPSDPVQLEALLVRITEDQAAASFGERIVLLDMVDSAVASVADAHGFGARSIGANVFATVEEQSTARTVTVAGDNVTALLQQALTVAPLLLSGTADLAFLDCSMRAEAQDRDYRRYHVGLAAPFARTVRPTAARRSVGGAIYVHERADRHHRGLLNRADDGTYLISSACAPVPRAPFIASRGALRRLAKGLSTRQWHRLGWTIAVPGLSPSAA